MDGGLPEQPRPTTLPGRIEALGSAAGRHPSWTDAAEASRSIGLGLIIRGLQPGQLVLVDDCRRPMWLPVICGALGAGAVVAGCEADTPIDDLIEFASRQRCKIVVLDQERRLEHLAEHGSRLPSLLALIGPASRPRRQGKPVILGLPDLLTLGRAVHQLDPGMWRECLAGIRPGGPALKMPGPADSPGSAMSHRECERALSLCLAEPTILAAGLASLLAKPACPRLDPLAASAKEHPS